MPFFLWNEIFFYRRYKKLYMCKMHKILYLDKTKRNRTGESKEKKTTKKCRIVA